MSELDQSAPRVEALFAAHRTRLAAAGIPLRARVVPVAGMLSWYQSGTIHLAFPADTDAARLQTGLVAGLIGLPPGAVVALFDALLPRLIGHEIGHALRDEAGRAGGDLLIEEQAAERFGDVLSATWRTPALYARVYPVLADATARLGGTAGAAAIHRHAELAARLLGLHATAEEEAQARAVIAGGAARDYLGWLRIAVAWAWIDLTLRLDEPSMISAPTSSEPTPSEPTHWLDAAVADLDRVSSEAGPALRRRLDRNLRLMARMNGGSGVASVLRRPSSTPFVPLIDALAADLGLSGDPRVALIGRSTVLLYAYVRVQDDLVDEPRRVDRASVFAAEALLSEHLALFGTAVPDARAAVLRARIMRRFADVAATEVDDRGRAQVVDGPLDWMGDKFLPMAVPLVGLAVAAERPELADELVRFVRTLGTGLQLVNDALNVGDDHRAGRSTPLLRWMAADGAVVPGAPLGAVLLGHPAMARSLAEARTAVDAAERIAQTARLPATAALATHARTMVEGAPLRLLASLLGKAI